MKKFLLKALFLGLFIHPISLLDASEGKNPISGISEMGDIVVVWEETDPKTHKVVLTVSTKAAQGTWTPRKVISNPLSNASNPLIVVNKRGETFVGWMEQDVSNVKLLVSQFLFGGNWTTATTVSSPNEKVVDFQQLVMNDVGVVSVTAVWTSFLGKNKFTCVRAASGILNGNWKAPVTLSSQ